MREHTQDLSKDFYPEEKQQRKNYKPNEIFILSFVALRPLLAVGNYNVSVKLKCVERRRIVFYIW